MNNVTAIPESLLKNVIEALKNIKRFPNTGKAILTIEINCGTGGTVSSYKMDTRTSEEFRNT